MFTENWNRFYSIWQVCLEHLSQRASSGIEIGVYEGRSTCWLMENILTHPDSVLWCIDTFEPFDGLAGDYEQRFIQNTADYEKKVWLTKARSSQALRMEPYYAGYDFVIVDGSHQAADVLEDAVLAWAWLKPGGVMIFDDMEWVGQGHNNCTETDKPKIAIQSFLRCYADKLEVLHSGYQAIVRKN